MPWKLDGPLLPLMNDDPNRCCFRNEGVNCWLENKWTPPRRRRRQPVAPPRSSPAGRTSLPSPAAVVPRAFLPQLQAADLRCIRPSYQPISEQEPQRRHLAGRWPPIQTPIPRRGLQSKDPSRSEAKIIYFFLRFSVILNLSI